MSTLRPVSSLLFTTAFLLAGHGLHMTFLPLRASELGLSQTLIGLSGSAYFAGFMTGALLIPPVIASEWDTFAALRPSWRFFSAAFFS
jgi:hypothetical protein